MDRNNKSETEILLETAEEMFKDARGMTKLEKKAINYFVRSKSKVILRKLLEKI